MCIFNNQCASDMRNSFWWIISCKDAGSRFSRLWLFARYSTPNLLLITALHLNFCQHWCLSCDQKRQFSSLYFLLAMFFKIFLPHYPSIPSSQAAVTITPGIGPFDTKRFWRDPYFLSQSVDNFVSICQFLAQSKLLSTRLNGFVWKWGGSRQVWKKRSICHLYKSNFVKHSLIGQNEQC